MAEEERAYAHKPEWQQEALNFVLTIAASLQKLLLKFESCRLEATQQQAAQSTQAVPVGAGRSARSAPSFSECHWCHWPSQDSGYLQTQLRVLAKL
eukprot:2032536-Amphidinium_carterae.1